MKRLLIKIKGYSLLAMSMIATIMTALFYHSKAKYEKAMRKGVEQVNETERKATEAAIKGSQRQQEARANAKKAVRDGTFFPDRK